MNILKFLYRIKKNLERKQNNKNMQKEIEVLKKENAILLDLLVKQKDIILIDEVLKKFNDKEEE